MSNAHRKSRVPFGPRPHGVTREIAEKYNDANLAPVGAKCDTCGKLRADCSLKSCQKCRRKYYVCVSSMFPSSVCVLMPRASWVCI